jgi:hypothetical protein
MAEQLIVYQPGDRFATIGRNGEARICQVQDDGSLVVVEYSRQPREALRKAERLLTGQEA